MASNWVSVTGSRRYPFTPAVWATLSPDEQLETIGKGKALVESNVARFKEDWGVVSGGAIGPDQWAVIAAEERGLETLVYPAEWDKYGRGAGHKRNKLIAHHADECLVFWDGESRGTNHFIKYAFELRRPLYIVGPTGTPWAIFDQEYWEQYDLNPVKMDIPKGN